MKKLTLSTAGILTAAALVFCINLSVKSKLNTINLTKKTTNNYAFKKFSSFNITDNLGQADGEIIN